MEIARTSRAREFINRGMVHSAILAGGFGQRLDAIADPSRNKWALAKPATPVGNIRIIEFGISALRKAGIHELNLLTCHLPETIRHVVGDGKIYGEETRIKELVEQSSDPLDTAGAVGRLVFNEGWIENPNDIVVIPSADIVHNVDLEAVVDVHLFNKEKHNAVGTIVVNPVRWDSVERFGTVRLENMPKREGFKTELEFEDAVSAYLMDIEGSSLKIEEFREKKSRFIQMELPEAQRYQEVALSNLNNSSIYVFNASFFRTLLKMLTKKDTESPLVPQEYQAGGPAPFSDWGRHVFKWLTEKAQLENFPIFAYIMPKSGYWRDAGIGEELRLANMDVLDGKLETGLSAGEGKFWHRMDNDSWKGNNVFIDPTAYISRSIIGDNVIIAPGARIIHSVVGRDTRIDPGVEMWGSVIFPRHRSNPSANVIGSRSQVSDSLILGGALDPESHVRNAALFTPVTGLALGSLLGKTQYLSPKK